MQPRMQQANFYGAFELFHDQTVNTDNTQPSFQVTSLMPWSNAPAGGYDQAFDIKGVMLDVFVYPDSFGADGITSTTGFAGLPMTEDSPPLFMKVCGDLFVDEVDVEGVPVSLLPSVTSDPYGPFTTNPPAASPALAPADHEVQPTRHLLRKYGNLTRVVQGEVQATESLDPAGILNGHSQANSAFRWSARLRKRFTVGQKQGLFLGVFATQDFDFVATNFFQIWTVHVAGTYYYRLRR